MKTFLLISLFAVSAQAELITNVFAAGVHSMQTNGFTLVEMKIQNFSTNKASVVLYDAPSTNVFYIVPNRLKFSPLVNAPEPVANEIKVYRRIPLSTAPGVRWFNPYPEEAVFKNGLLLVNDVPVRIILEK
jgi:hypothetical protein